MPPIADVTHERLFELLKEEQMFDKNGNALYQTNPVWKTLCLKYNLKIQPKSLHLHMYKDCVGKCRTKILEHRKIRFRKKKRRRHAQMQTIMYIQSKIHTKKNL